VVYFIADLTIKNKQFIKIITLIIAQIKKTYKCTYSFKKIEEESFWEDFCYSNDGELERIRQLKKESTKEYRDRQTRLERKRNAT